MNCKELAEKIAKLKQDVSETNVQHELAQRDLEAKDLDDALDLIQKHTGLSKKDLQYILERSGGQEKDRQELAEHSEKADAEAQVTVEGLNQKKEGDPPNKTFLQGMKENVRKSVADWIERSISILPKGASKGLLRRITDFAQENDVHSIGEGVEVGRATEAFLREDLKKLHSDIVVNNRSFMKLDEMREAIGILGNMRGEKVDNYISETRKWLDQIKNSPHEDKFNPIIKQLPRWLDLAEQANKEPAVRSFVDDMFRKMDVARDYAVKNGFLDKGKGDFFHNIVAIKDHVSVWEKLVYDEKYDISSFRDQKKYKNGIEAMKLGGVMPATMDAQLILSHYWKAYGNASRKARFADILRGEAELGAKSDMTIEEKGKQLPAVVTKEMLTDDMKGYRQLDIINSNFRGIYAHPEMHKWATSLFAGPRPSGAVETFMKYNGMWKGITLAFGLYHAKSLVSKGLSAAAAMEEGGKVSKALSFARWSPYQKMISAWGVGTEALRSGSADHATLINLVENGLSFHLNDGLYSALNHEYNIKTGELTVKSKLLDYVDKATGWQHRFLFEKLHPRLKAGLAIQAVKSKWFENLVREKGGNRDEALRTVASMMNDTFGARNLEAAGRSPLTQRFLQAAFLAPDWQESKIRRIFGAALYEDPQQRKVLQAALISELAAVATIRMVAQQLYCSMNGVTRSEEEQAQDIINGRFGSIWIGRTKDKKGKQVDHYLNIFGSEQQDMRLVLTLFKAMWEAGKAGGAPKEAGKVLVEEYKSKASPMTRTIFDLAQRQFGEDKKEMKLIEPSTYLDAPAPIAIQQAIKAAKDAKEGEGAKEFGKNIFTGFIGTSLDKKTVPKEEKKKRIRIFK